MEVVTKYWSQLALCLGLIGVCLKMAFDFSLKKKELKNKFFYEIKANKIVELYDKIVKIQMVIDRGTRNEIFPKRIELDKFYWESSLYFSKRTVKSFHTFLELLKFFEDEKAQDYYKEYRQDFEKVVKILLKDFKHELV